MTRRESHYIGYQYDTTCHLLFAIVLIIAVLPYKEVDI